MDKKLARQFVKKVGPLEHSKNPKDKKAAKAAERKLRRILPTIPKPRRLTA
jgi:hypothetical protein